MPNKDEIKGKVEQAKGKVKQEIGKATDDQDLHDEGVADEAAGEVQQGFGTAKRKGVTRSRISAIGSSTERIDSLFAGLSNAGVLRADADTRHRPGVNEHLVP